MSDSKPHISNFERFDRWRVSAILRRLLLFGLTGAQTVIASRYMLGFLPEQGETPLEIGIMILFAILFAWISLGFWTAFFGFVSLLTRFDKLTVTGALARPSNTEFELAKTACP